MKRARILLPVGLLVLALGVAAQNRGPGGRGWGGGGFRRWGGHGGGGDQGVVYTEEGVPVDTETVKSAREIASHSTGTPTWTNTPGFERDVFTFVRTMWRRASDSSGISYSSSPMGWITDFPDSDLNLSFRLQQVTSMRTDPDGRVVRFTDPALFDYPWIYMVEPGGLELKPEEIPILRNYLENGGVLWADDFWGVKQWDNLARQMKLVLPNRRFVDLDMTNPIFHCVFDIKVPMNKLQTPNYMQGRQSLYPGPRYGITWEPYHDDYEYGGEGAHDMHVRAIYDDKGRIMVIATHNCDNGDGWEREGEFDDFFHEFSEKRAYPLAVNVIFYLMTH